ncbi:lymphocyte antigen 6 family member K [Homo sapiens]|uniref:Isoform 2 of Lymphocyte antigen 6K n=1 Tax=Homo sapiens TaxID=9606 RepID=Q17RY6-2|nr:lymphocyte antigen 6K isoform 3 precursor [Homo sapiens]KAI2551526.1 lymphocyte antigen 6 family member K [Homo sapiens]KAI4012171.1 lymphocyte antigen 6 family member K [Homo sapiens]|eukprot:NP_001153827.1 lymphocyte antigen 6K isoform 3 precursor [Homo sapiens]
MALLALLLVVALPRVWTDANLTARQRDPEDSQRTDEGDNRVWCHVCERENTFECQNPRRCKWTEPYCVIAAVTVLRWLCSDGETQARGEAVSPGRAHALLLPQVL